MDKKQLLTITEFAAASCKSRQAIYKQLNKKLSPYVTIVDNQKMIDKKALIEVYGVNIDNQESKPGDNQETTKILIDMLQYELNEKNKQIAEMQKLLDQEQQLRMAEHKRILELEDKVQQAEIVNQEEDHKSWWKKIFS